MAAHSASFYPSAASSPRGGPRPVRERRPLVGASGPFVEGTAAIVES
ncbi:hypothetical protein [Sphingomonas agri]